MSFSGSSPGSFIRPHPCAAARISAAVAMGLAMLAIGAAPAAADQAEGQSNSATAADGVARAADRREDANANDPAAEADHRAADANDRAADAPDKTELARVGEIESEVRVTAAAPKPVQVCRKVRVTGTRMPKTVCSVVAQNDGDEVSDKAADQRTQDYLRRRDGLSTRRSPNETGFTGGQPLGGLTQP
jgi:hypothetical protein